MFKAAQKRCLLYVCGAAAPLLCTPVVSSSLNSSVSTMSNPTEEGGGGGVLKDLMSRHWTKLGEAPREILLFCAIVPWDDKRAIITGGSDGNTDRPSDSVFVYNKETMETENLPSMLQKRLGHCAIVVGGNLFVIGGYLGPSRITNSVEVLDLNDPREWKQFPVSLETVRCSCSAVAVNEHEIFIIGGFDGGGQHLNSVEILNTVTQTISQGPPMLESRHGATAVFLEDFIVVSGDYTGQELTSACEQLSIEVSSNEEEARQWQPLHSNMTVARSQHYGLTFGDCMVVVGGVTRLALESRTTEVWNSTTGAWAQIPAKLPAVDGRIVGFVKLGEDLVCFLGGKKSKGLLSFQCQRTVGAPTTPDSFRRAHCQRTPRNCNSSFIGRPWATKMDLPLL